MPVGRPRLQYSDFLIRAGKSHNLDYTYPKSVENFTSDTLVEVNCNRCEATFTAKSSDIMSGGGGCKKCARRNYSEKEILEKYRFVHGDKYNYSKVTIYKRRKDNKVEIFCKKCKIWFWQDYIKHYEGHGHSCTRSKGESKIERFLLDHNIDHIREKRFVDCRSTKHGILRWDFYLPYNNMLIEYDGEQHFIKEKNDRFKIDVIRKNDSIKNKYAQEKGIVLLRIPYIEFKNVETILKETLCL
jgi:very-short-patch-repair endonuclease